MVYHFNATVLSWWPLLFERAQLIMTLNLFRIKWLFGVVNHLHTFRITTPSKDREGWPTLSLICGPNATFVKWVANRRAMACYYSLDFIIATVDFSTLSYIFVSISGTGVNLILLFSNRSNSTICVYLFACYLSSVHVNGIDCVPYCVFISGWGKVALPKPAGAVMGVLFHLIPHHSFKKSPMWEH